MRHWEKTPAIHHSLESQAPQTGVLMAAMMQQAKSAVGMAARRLGRTIDGIGAVLETHPYTEKCERESHSQERASARGR